MPFVQIVGSYGSTTTSNSVVIPVGSPTTPGNTLLIFVKAGGGNTVSSATDSQGNTYTVDTTSGSANANAILVRGVLTKALGTSDTITLTINTTIAQRSAYAVEWSGLVTASNPLDQHVGASGTNGSLGVTAGPTATTTQANELWLAVSASGKSTTPVTWTPPGSPWIEIPNPQPSINFVDASYQEVSAVGTPSATYANSYTGVASTLVATYLLAAGGSTPAAASCNMAATGGMSGAPQASAQASGTAAAAGIASGSLQVTAQLSGAAAASGQTSGTPQAATQASISGVASAAGALSGSPRVTAQLVGATAAIGQIGASPQVAGQLAGNAQAAGSLSAAPSVSARVSSALNAQGILAGQPVAAGSATSVFTAQGQLGGQPITGASPSGLSAAIGRFLGQPLVVPQASSTMSSAGKLDGQFQVSIWMTMLLDALGVLIGQPVAHSTINHYVVGPTDLRILNDGVELAMVGKDLSVSELRALALGLVPWSPADDVYPSSGLFPVGAGAVRTVQALDMKILNNDTDLRFKDD